MEEKFQPQIIGLSAQLQNGKDTVAALILKLTSKDSPYSPWTTRRFAGKLKEMTAILLACSVEQLEDIEFKNKPLGEEWRRWYFTHYKVRSESNPDARVSPFFSNEADAEAYRIRLVQIIDTEGLQLENELLTPRKILQIVGTEGGRDVVHPNIWVNATLGDLTEYDRTIITDARFPNEVIGIKKKKGIVVKIIRPSVVSTSTHPSETSLNDYTDWDYVIINDGSLEQLEEKVEQMLRHFNLI
jgi:hypothetical protein